MSKPSPIPNLFPTPCRSRTVSTVFSNAPPWLLPYTNKSAPSYSLPPRVSSRRGQDFKTTSSSTRLPSSSCTATHPTVLSSLTTTPPTLDRNPAGHHEAIKGIERSPGFRRSVGSMRLDIKGPYIPKSLSSLLFELQNTCEGKYFLLLKYHATLI